MNATGTDRFAGELEPRPRVLVIGYGNPLRGDDAVGWVVAQRLAERVDPDTVICMAVHQLAPELAEPISRVDLLILIDAAANIPPGYLSSRSVDATPEPQQVSMTHHFTAQRLLVLAQRVYGHAPHGLLFTIGAEDFGHKEELSRSVEQTCDRLVKHLVRIVSPESAARV
jgi:hydrogenase maturation protease